MTRYLLRRAAGAVMTLLAASLLSYLLIYLGPGDPAAVIVARRIGRMPTPIQVEQFRVEYGLDRPPLVQYLDWLGQTLRGDFGYSIRTGEPVFDELGARLGATFILAGLTTLFTVMLGLPLGVMAAIRENSLWDYTIRLFALAGVSIPNFWLAFLLILLFAVELRWLPSHGMNTVRSAILPVIALGIANAAALSQMTRSLLRSVRHQDYLRTAYGKGLGTRAVWLRHAVPNVLAPVLTLVAIQFSNIAAGSVIIETLFAWPGIGNFYALAVGYRDIPVIQAMVVFFTTLFVLVNLVVDLAHVWLDPRLGPT